MSEITPENSPKVENPKPGTLAAVRERVTTALIANTDRATSQEIDSKTKERAEANIKMQGWQLDALDSLATAKAYHEVESSGSFDPDKTAIEMTALEAVQLLEEWIKPVLDNPESHDEGLSKADVEKYAADLHDKLVDESSRAT